MLGPERPEAVSTERGVVLTDLQSSIDVNKLFSLSLSLSLSTSSGSYSNFGNVPSIPKR